MVGRIMTHVRPGQRWRWKDGWTIPDTEPVPLVVVGQDAASHNYFVRFDNGIEQIIDARLFKNGHLELMPNEKLQIKVGDRWRFKPAAFIVTDVDPVSGYVEVRYDDGQTFK